MDKKKLMLLLGAGVVALGSTFAVRSVLSGHSTPVVQAAILQPTGPKVLVALHALPVGTIISPDAVDFKPWPKDLVQDTYFLDGTADKTKLVGTVVRSAITAGQPLTQGELVAPGDRGFLAAALTPGMRAVTIPVSDMSGVGGFIFPGDHVDMMLTQTVKNTNPTGANDQTLFATETVLRNLRILATDQATETEISPTGKSVVKSAHNVTLEVTPRLAEKIEVAQTLGSLSLALRPLADNQSELDHAIASGSLKLPVGATKQDEDRLIATAANRPVEGATSFSTGGDVSRFARRSLPAAPAKGGAIQNATSMLGEIAGPTVRITRGNSITVQPIGNSLAARMQSFAAMRNGQAPVVGLPSPPSGMQPLQPAAVGGM